MTTDPFEAAWDAVLTDYCPLCDRRILGLAETCAHEERLCYRCCQASHDETCPDCDGRGRIVIGDHGDIAWLPVYGTCANCEGTGKAPRD